jgi:hypothetical protein
MTIAIHDGDDHGLTIGDVLPLNEPSPLDKLAIIQRDQWLIEEIDLLPPSQRMALLAVMFEEDRKLGGAHRINKMRAVDKIVGNLPKSLKGKAIRSANKGRKRKVTPVTT